MLAVAVGLVTCGGGRHGGVAVRVGENRITDATVAHWMSIMAPEHVVPDPPSYTACVSHQAALSPQSIEVALKEECAQEYQALRRRALGFLISSQWLIGEAAERGLDVSDGGADRRTRQGTAAQPSGAGADAKLKSEAYLASAAIRNVLRSGEPRIAAAQVAAYYRRNKQRYESPERRYIDIVERLPSKAAARRALSEIVRMRSMARVALHESFEETGIAAAEPRKRAILRAIFGAKPHTLVGPLPLNKKWCFFEVTRVTRAVLTPLAQVRAAIERQLASERQQRTLARFIGAWRKKWIARTDCGPGYVVQKCRQYRGARVPEDPAAFD